MVGPADRRRSSEGGGLRYRVEYFRLGYHPALIVAADNQDFTVFEQRSRMAAPFDVELGVPIICARAGTAEAMTASRPTTAINDQVTSRSNVGLSGRDLMVSGWCFIRASKQLFIALSLFSITFRSRA